ncbi:MAG: T9SS type A sorting domain-containing protein [Janthinobacterium lividum]
MSLLPLKGYPRQFEFSTATTKQFDAVEISFDPVGLSFSLNIFGGDKTEILYAYGVTQGEPKALTGYFSRFATPASNQYTAAVGSTFPVSVCVGNAITDPLNAVSYDLNDYATVSNLLGVNCASFLKVDLNGKAPAVGYRAGFVIGTSGLLGASVLNGYFLRTYLNGTLQETSGALSLLDVTLLANGKTFVSFKTTKEFNAVSIERSSTASVLYDMRLYFGFGLPEAIFTNWGRIPVITSLPITFDNLHKTFEVYTAALLCFSCNSYIITPASVPEDAYILLHNGLGTGIINQVVFTQLTGPGLAGYRAGVVLGETTLLDVDLQRGLVIATFDANGKILETATSESLITVNLLPNRRRELSFRTTRDFASIGLLVSTVAAFTSDLNVYSAFADEGGLLQGTTPDAPLPVVLTSFAVTRAAGATAADVAWATASEQRSASFVVERTTDPQAGFTAIGKVAAAGTSTASHQYSLRDAAAPTRVTSYYRLRQVDIDGTETLSPVVALAATDAAASGFALYPNPTSTGAVSLSLGTSVADGTVVIYSTVGQVVRQQAVSSASGQPDPTLSTKGLPNGIYQVVLRDGSGQSLGTQRLVIAN